MNDDSEGRLQYYLNHTYSAIGVIAASRESGQGRRCWEKPETYFF